MSSTPAPHAATYPGGRRTAMAAPGRRGDANLAPLAAPARAMAQTAADEPR
jgi:hypothetical protein